MKTCLVILFMGIAFLSSIVTWISGVAVPVSIVLWIIGFVPGVMILKFIFWWCASLVVTWVSTLIMAAIAD